jgi:NhaP-type Na+/H+ or K+/H+ antiporter
MRDPIFHYTAIALAAGMLAQTVAARLAIPSIVTLLAAGVVLGPDVLGLFDPSVFHAGRTDLVTLAVTVILFEGALALDLGRLRQQQWSIVLLLTIGSLVSLAAGTAAAHGLIGMPWSVAVLYGALMIVTGPTVVTPLLSRLTLDRRVRELLVSEGVLIDPVGAIIAIVAAEAVVRGHATAGSPGHVLGPLAIVGVLGPLAIGGVLGALAGIVMVRVLRRRWVPDELVSPVVLGLVLAVAAIASRVSTDAGLMAAVVLGIVLGNGRLPELKRLREFKEALTVILLSLLFIVLAADLRLASVASLGWAGLGVVAVMMWAARPIAVALATLGSDLGIGQRAFVAWICPRGIVAAAVAGYFRDLLNGAGLPWGRELEALVFLTVAVTVIVQGLTARPIAHLLGVDVPRMIGTIVVGADHYGRLLARLLLALGRPAVVIDRSALGCRAARKDGLPVFEGDALSAEVLEEAGARYADTVVAVTRNPELNELLAQRVKATFAVQRVLAVGPSRDEDADDGRAGVFPGRFPGIDEVTQQIRFDRVRVVRYDVGEGDLVGARLGALPFADGEFTMLLTRGASTFVAVGADTVAKGDRLWCLRPTKTTSPLAESATSTVYPPRSIRPGGIEAQGER